MIYRNAQENKPYLLVSLYITIKILLYGALLKEQKCPFMVFLRYCNRWLIKIVKPIYLSSYGSITNFGTISMGTKNTFMCKIIKGTKTPIMHFMDNCHFNWLNKL